MKPLLEFTEHPRCTNAGYQVCNSVHELATNAPVPEWFVISWWVEYFKNCPLGGTMVLLQEWACWFGLKVQSGAEFLRTVLRFLNMWSYHSVCQQQTIAVVICAREEKEKIFAGCSSEDRAGFKGTCCGAGWTSGWMKVYPTSFIYILKQKCLWRVLFSSRFLWLNFEQENQQE